MNPEICFGLTHSLAGQRSSSPPFAPLEQLYPGQGLLFAINRRCQALACSHADHAIPPSLHRNLSRRRFTSRCRVSHACLLLTAPIRSHSTVMYMCSSVFRAAATATALLTNPRWTLCPNDLMRRFSALQGVNVTGRMGMDRPSRPYLSKITISTMQGIL